MSPLGQSPSDHGGSKGDKDGENTHKETSIGTNPRIRDQDKIKDRDHTGRNANNNNTTRQVNDPRNNCDSVYKENSNVTLGNSLISRKPRRNTEQRKPGSKTLKDFFPIINRNKTTSTQQEIILETPHHWLRRVRSQNNYNVQLKQTNSQRRTQIKERAVGVITPEETTITRKRSGKHYNSMGTKTNRTIRMEFDLEKANTTRQSKLYNNDEWFRQDNHKSTAGNFFGHSMAQIDNTTVYRVLLQNTNGIDPSPTNLDFQLSLNACFDQCIAFLSLTETNTEWNNFTHRDNLRASLKKWWDGSVVQTSTSTIPFTDKYKPGGTVSVVCGNHWVARIIEKGEDEAGLGRWTYIGLQGNQHTKILHITWYLVCAQTVSAVGEKTAYMQQYKILKEKFPDMNINPRRQSVLDMQLFITKKLEEGYFVILSTDGNENLSKK